MSVFANIWLIAVVGGLPTILSLLLGGYWLKNERFPWEHELGGKSVQDIGSRASLKKKESRFY